MRTKAKMRNWDRASRRRITNKIIHVYKFRAECARSIRGAINVQLNGEAQFGNRSENINNWRFRKHGASPA